MAFTSRFKPTRFTAANANTTNSEASFQIPSSALANWDAQDYLLADVDDDDLDFLKAGDFTLSTPTPASRRASLASARGRKEEEGKADEGRVEEEEAEVETTPVARRVSRVSVGLGASTASGNRTTAASTSANAITNTHSEPSPEPEPEVLSLPSHRQPEPQSKIESQPEHGLRNFANLSRKSPSSTPTPTLDNPLPIDPHSAAHTSSTSVSPHSISDDHRSPRPRPTPAVATLINNGNTRARCFRNASAISEENNARFSDSILTHAPAPSISLQEDVAPPASPLKSSPSPKEENPRAVETEMTLKFSRRGRRTTISSSAVPCECSDAYGSADAGPNTRLHLANSATEAAAKVVVGTAAAVEEPSSALRAESAPCASDISRSPTESIIDLSPAVAFSPRSGDYASVEHTSSPACAGAVASASVPIVGDSLPGEEVNNEGQEDQQGVTSIVKSISHSPGSGPVTKRKREEDEGEQINHEVDRGALPHTSVTGPQRGAPVGSVAAQAKPKSNSNLHQTSKSKPISTQNRKTSAQQQHRVQSTSQLARLHKKHGLGEREDEVKASTLPDVKKRRVEKASALVFEHPVRLPVKPADKAKPSPALLNLRDPHLSKASAVRLVDRKLSSAEREIPDSKTRLGAEKADGVGRQTPKPVPAPLQSGDSNDWTFTRPPTLDRDGAGQDTASAPLSSISIGLSENCGQEDVVGRINRDLLSPVGEDEPMPVTNMLPDSLSESVSPTPPQRLSGSALDKEAGDAVASGLPRHAKGEPSNEKSRRKGRTVALSADRKAKLEIRRTLKAAEEGPGDALVNVGLSDKGNQMEVDAVERENWSTDRDGLIVEHERGVAMEEDGNVLPRDGDIGEPVSRDCGTSEAPQIGSSGLCIVPSFATEMEVDGEPSATSVVTGPSSLSVSSHASAVEMASSLADEVSLDCRAPLPATQMSIPLAAKAGAEAGELVVLSKADSTSDLREQLTWAHAQRKPTAGRHQAVRKDTRTDDMFQRKQRDSYLQKGIDLTAHSSSRFQKGSRRNATDQSEAGPSTQNPMVNGVPASRNVTSSGSSSSTAASRARTTSGASGPEHHHLAKDKPISRALVRNTTKQAHSELSTAKENPMQQVSKSSRDVDGSNKGACGQGFRTEDRAMAKRENGDGDVKGTRKDGKKRHDNSSQGPSSRQSQSKTPPLADPAQSDIGKRNSLGDAIAETLVSLSQKIMGSFGLLTSLDDSNTGKPESASSSKAKAKQRRSASPLRLSELSPRKFGGKNAVFRSDDPIDVEDDIFVDDPTSGIEIVDAVSASKGSFGLSRTGAVDSEDDGEDAAYSLGTMPCKRSASDRLAQDYENPAEGHVQPEDAGTESEFAGDRRAKRSKRSYSLDEQGSDADIISFGGKAHDDCFAVRDRAANDGIDSNGHGGQHVKSFPSSSSSSMPGKSRVRGKGGPASGMSSMANSDQNTKRATNSRRPPLSKGKTSSRTSGRENEGRKLYHSLTVPVSTTFATERLKQQRALAKSERNATSLNGDSRAKASQSTGNDGSARLPLSHKNAHQNMVAVPSKATFQYETAIRSEQRRIEFKDKMKTWEKRVSSVNAAHNPNSDFKATQSVHEATESSRRQQIAPTKPVAPHFSTEARIAERHKFEEGRRARELEIERQVEERRRAEEEEEERKWREQRRRAIPKANPVPEWYADVPRKASKSKSGNAAGAVSSNFDS